MKVATTFGAQMVGLKSVPIRVETDVSPGLYNWTIVGLPDKTIDESKERIQSALKNNNYSSPKSKNHKLTVSLSPAEIKKEGSAYDLAIAVSYLASIGEIENEKLGTIMFVGELSLTGEIRKTNGIIAIIHSAKQNNFNEIFVPYENKEEASIIDGITIYCVKNIKDVVEHLKQETILKAIEHKQIKNAAINYPDIGEIRGQLLAKRALEIAGAGGHNICLYGPPGTGKTMLAKAFTGILPNLDFEQALDVANIHSVGNGNGEIYLNPRLRAPHHTSSYVSLIGGGSTPKPGEITLAHHGVLFLDEFPEFEGKSLEALREPLEEGQVRISRAKGSETFPSKFILVAAMNPCPCGYFGSKIKECTCKQFEIQRYQNKISGPIMDRIDLWVFVQHLSYEELSNKKEEVKETEKIKLKIENARKFSNTFKSNLNIKNKLNKELSPKEIEKLAVLGEKERNTLNNLASKFLLSPRAYHRILRVARTIADLDQKEKIEEKHIVEAFQYRPKLG